MLLPPARRGCVKFPREIPSEFLPSGKNSRGPSEILQRSPGLIRTIIFSDALGL
jgi:hypothetical protein